MSFLLYISTATHHGNCKVLLCFALLPHFRQHLKNIRNTYYKPKLISFTPGTQNFSNEGMNCYYNSWALFFLLESNFLAIWDGEREMVSFKYRDHMPLISSAKSASGSLLSAVKLSLFSHTIWTKVASLSASISELSDPGHETD